MEKKWTENRPLATLALVVAIAVGVVGIGGAKLKGAVSVADEYYNKYILADMQLRLGAAQGVVAEGSVLEADNVALVQATEAVRKLANATNSAQAMQANTAVTQTVGTLYETLRAQTGEPAKGSVLQTQWSELLSRGDRINHQQEAYTEQANKASKAKSGFPASLLAGIYGLN